EPGEVLELHADHVGATQVSWQPVDPDEPVLAIHERDGLGQVLDDLAAELVAAVELVLEAALLADVARELERERVAARALERHEASEQMPALGVRQRQRELDLLRLAARERALCAGDQRGALGLGDEVVQALAEQARRVPRQGPVEEQDAPLAIDATDVAV